MLRNLGLSRLVKRRRLPARHMAIPKLIKRVPFLRPNITIASYGIDDGARNILTDTIIPHLLTLYPTSPSTKDAEASRFSVLWKTRVG